MELTFRQSDFTAFMNCRRSWAMGSVLKLHKKREAPSVSAVGTLFHLGAQAWYSGGSKELALATVRAHIATDREHVLSPAWLKEFDSNGVLAVRMVEGYIDWVLEEGKDVGWTVAGVERTISVEWPGRPGITVTGTADLEIVDHWDLIKLVDFKTRDSVDPGFADSIDFQRKAYAVLRLLEDGVMYAGAIHRYAKRSKRTSRATPPFFGEHELHFTVEGLRRHFKIMDTMLGEMVPLAQQAADLGVAGLTAPALYPNPGKDCSWRCPFTEVCDTVDSGGFEYMLSEWYESATDKPEEAND